MAFAASEQPVTELPGSNSFLGRAGSAKGLERAGGPSTPCGSGLALVPGKRCLGGVSQVRFLTSLGCGDFHPQQPPTAKGLSEGQPGQRGDTWAWRRPAGDGLGSAAVRSVRHTEGSQASEGRMNG